jgi:hypothetical protein
MNIIEHNVSTGEVLEREMTSDEIEQRETDEAVFTAMREAEAEKSARRAEILHRLGLTEDEAKLILG